MWSATGPTKALEYARASFGPYQESEMAEIQRLMGCLCFVRRPGASPYADLMAPSLWSDVAREFSRQCCGLLGQVRGHIARCPSQKTQSLHALVCGGSTLQSVTTHGAQPGAALHGLPILASLTPGSAASRTALGMQLVRLGCKQGCLCRRARARCWWRWRQAAWRCPRSSSWPLSWPARPRTSSHAASSLW